MKYNREDYRLYSKRLSELSREELENVIIALYESGMAIKEKLSQALEIIAKQDG